MEQELVTIKVTPKSREALRILAALTGKKQYEVLETLVATAVAAAGIKP